MQKRSLVLFAAALAVSSATAAADARPVVGVVEFENLAGPLPWWTGGAGNELARLTSDGLAAVGSLSIMSRLDVANALAPAEASEPGEGSRYLVRAAVSYYREDGASRRSRFRLGGVHIGGRTRSAEIAVDYQIVELGTGRAIHRDTIDSRSAGLDLDVGFYEPELSGDLSRYRNQPVGKVIGKVVEEMARQIECVLVESSCER